MSLHGSEQTYGNKISVVYKDALLICDSQNILMELHKAELFIFAVTNYLDNN